MARARKQREKQADAGPPPRRNRAAAIGLDAADLARAAFRRAGFDEFTLVLRWREIAGAEVAAIAQPLRLTQGASGGTLTLKVDPAAALFLQHDSRSLCSRINTYLGGPAVQSFRFVPGEIAAERRSQSPEAPRHDVALHDPAARFAGPEGLKEELLALARARQK